MLQYGTTSCLSHLFKAYSQTRNCCGATKTRDQALAVIPEHHSYPSAMKHVLKQFVSASDLSVFFLNLSGMYVQ